MDWKVNQQHEERVPTGKHCGDQATPRMDQGKKIKYCFGGQDIPEAVYLWLRRVSDMKWVQIPNL
jgi:hypothetical protein